MPAKVKALGPGLLTIGATGEEVDVSCQITAMRIAWDKDADDDVKVLCGETAAGAIEYTATLTGTIFQDFDDDAGISVMTWEHKGEQFPFIFVPATDWAQQASGIVTLDPVDFGGDEVGANMTADVEWAIVGEPVLEPVPPVVP